MKRIDAIIRPERLDAVREAFDEAIDDLGNPGITVAEVKGHGAQRGIVEQWRGREYRVQYLSKVWILMVVADNVLEKAIELILDNATTGEIGDGKIFISTVDDIIRVRTRERGEIAI
jgi:nitrogen regulatory protein P-II 1